MIVALEEAKRKLGELRGVIAELGNQLRIEESRERAADLERETMVQDFWNDAEKSSKKLQEIKQLKTKIESYEELSALVEYPEKITFKLEGYEIGKNVMDIKLTDDKGFLSNNNLILEGQGRFIIYEDNNGKPAIVMTEEEYNNYLGFVNGKFEAGKSYWIIVIPEYDGYHEGAGGKFISLPESAEAYKLEGASDAQVIINGELYAYGFKLAPLSSATDTPPADSGNSGESDESNTENKAPDDNKETNATDSTEKATDEKVTDKEDDETDAPTKGGCGSSIALSTLAIAGLIGTALIIKKKEN